MLAIAFKFPGGRYHGTPWGRHVNEADLEWPPSTWRLVRALIAVWHRKLQPQEQDAELLAGLLASLVTEPPHYQLPEGVHTHTRHYMPSQEGKSTKSRLIFDAFARLDPEEPLVMAWPSVALSDEQAPLLDLLLERLGFLGRAESWVEAARLPDWNGSANCWPGDDSVDKITGESRESIALQLPMPPAEYTHFRAAQLEGMDKRAGLKPREKKAIKATLPEDWLDAVAMDSSDLQKAGWSAPPAARSVTYTRPQGLLKPVGRPPVRRRSLGGVTTFRFALYGKPLPRIEDTIRVAEMLRRATMSRIKSECGEDAIPALISGHDLPEGNRHQHAFWLPEDADGDGRIDHLVVHVPGEVDGAARGAIETLHWLKNQEGQEWRLLFEGSGGADAMSQQSTVMAGGRTFESMTPYLMPWHAKNGFGVEEQIRRECRERGLPEPEAVELLDGVMLAGKRRRAIDYHRFRSRKGVRQPDTRGQLLRLEFPEEVATGPLALGFACHFGMGLFRSL
jgi:CRISPR-associated protein Csb2